MSQQPAATPTRAELRERLASQPRIRLASLPTPFEPLPRLTEELGGPQLWVKRDDLTGLAFGGHKTRALEYVLGDVMQAKPEMLVTGAGLQSNWCRQAAAAAAKLGVPIVLVLARTDATEVQGNLLVDYWLGAQVRLVTTRERTEVDAHIQSVAEELRTTGARAVGFASQSATCALGYLDLAAELDEQFEHAGIAPTRVWLSASGATLGALTLGARLMDWPTRITGVEPIERPHESTPALAARTANEAAALLGLPDRLDPSELDSREGFIGPGYHVPSTAGLDAMLRAARADALLLDPSYTGKAMAALIASVASGELTDRDTVVFIHTGGLPAAFAANHVIAEAARVT